MNPRIRGNENAQATLELAIFGSLLLIVLLTLLSYTRSIREQHRLEMEVFQEAANASYAHTFTAYDETGDTFEDSGATVSKTKTIDQQAGVLFEPNRRSYSASYTVYWSGAETPPDLTDYRINDETISFPKKKLTKLRDEDATDTTDGELRLKADELAATVGPVVASAVAKFVPTNWWGSYAPYVGYAAMAFKAACFAYLTYKVVEGMAAMESAEERQERLEAIDEEEGKKGWRVATKGEDEYTDGIDAGKYYVKEIEAQVYDQGSMGTTETDLTETRREVGPVIINRRAINLKDRVSRTFKRRYDETDDSRLPPEEHTYTYAGEDGGSLDVTLEQGLTQEGNYSSSAVGTTVSREQEWQTNR